MAERRRKTISFTPNRLLDNKKDGNGFSDKEDASFGTDESLEHYNIYDIEFIRQRQENLNYFLSDLETDRRI